SLRGALATKQSTPRSWRYGLLRFARNDARDQFTSICSPSRLMISANFVVSACTKSENCCGVPQSAVAPMLPRVLLTSSRASIALISLLSASTAGAGVALGRKIRNQEEASNFESAGTPSAMVGRLGAAGLLS